MTVTSYRSHEPLYIVTIRHPNAVKLIESWIQKTNASVTQESHRIKIHDYRHLNLFLLVPNYKKYQELNTWSNIELANRISLIIACSNTIVEKNTKMNLNENLVQIV
jgi:hypothetical protein